MLLEDDDPDNPIATANASPSSSRPAPATAKRPATATAPAKDTLRGEPRTPGTATGAAAAQLHAAARGDAFLSASPNGYWPASTQSIQSVQRGGAHYKPLKTPAPARPAAQEAVRARSPQGAQEPQTTRPKSALRFLPAEEFQHTIEVERGRDPARERESARAWTCLERERARERLSLTRSTEIDREEAPRAQENV